MISLSGYSFKKTAVKNTEKNIMCVTDAISSLKVSFFSDDGILIHAI